MRAVINKNRYKKVLLFFIMFVCMTLLLQKPIYADQDRPKDRSYVYTTDMEDVPIPDPYQFQRALNLTDRNGTKMANPIDMFVTEEEQIYVLDSDTGTIEIYDKELSPVKIIDKFFYEGQESPLKKPEGLFVTKEGVIYIADTENNRIIASDQEGNISSVIKKPKNIVGSSIDQFLPVKLVVDSINRVSVIARNINMGFMQFDSNGSFMGYTGAPSVKLTAMDRIWRLFSSQAQRAQMSLFVPTEYNNLKIDEKGFLWGTISSISAKEAGKAATGDTSISPVKKINSTGKDVLKRNGILPPIGDFNFVHDPSGSPSKIIDVAFGPGNVYSLLDSNDGKIFTYNGEGDLLYVFGRIGNCKGNFERPAAIDYLGNRLVVLDNALSQLVLFELTDYGNKIMEATILYADGKYSLTYDKWKEVAESNTNFQHAFIGLGNAKMNEGKYREAMSYFEYSNDIGGYSEAKEMLRKEQARHVFPYVFIGIIGICLFFTIRSIVNKAKRYARGL